MHTCTHTRGSTGAESVSRLYVQSLIFSAWVPGNGTITKIWIRLVLVFCMRFIYQEHVHVGVPGTEVWLKRLQLLLLLFHTGTSWEAGGSWGGEQITT